jgi:hypothetical protein
MATVALLSCLLPFCLHVGDSQLTQVIAFLGLSCLLCLLLSLSLLALNVGYGRSLVSSKTLPFTRLIANALSHFLRLLPMFSLNAYSPSLRFQTQRNHFLDYGHIQTIAISSHNFLSKFLALLA